MSIPKPTPTPSKGTPIQYGGDTWYAYLAICALIIVTVVLFEQCVMGLIQAGAFK